jgi:hypothetical protein
MDPYVAEAQPPRAHACMQVVGRHPDEEVSICIVGLTDAMTALIISKQTQPL